MTYIRRLDHASIRIADVARSSEFYEKMLGLTPIDRPDFGFPGRWYGLGEGQLHLIQREPGGVASARALDPTEPHFAIAVDDLAAIRQRLVDGGLAVLELGSEQMWVRDPDGYTVELRQAGR